MRVAPLLSVVSALLALRAGSGDPVAGATEAVAQAQGPVSQELSALPRSEVFLCPKCGAVVARGVHYMGGTPEARFLKAAMAEPSLGAAGTVLRFSNPMTNDEHDVVRFTEAEGAVTDGDSHTAVSYFPGYSWSQAVRDPSWSLGTRSSKARRHRESTNPKYFTSHFFDGGQHCDETGKGRQTEVQYLCCNGVHNAIIAVDEPDVCSYKVQSCEASILFDGWETTSCGSYVGAVIAVVLVAVLRQALAALRRGLRSRAKASRVTLRDEDGAESLVPMSPGAKGAIQLASTRGVPRDEDALLSRRKPGLIADYRSHPAVARIAVAVDAVLALAVGIIGAFNMLILMTMNWGLFLGVCVGEVVGMVIFDPAVPMSDWQARLAGGTGDVDTCH
ncbi:hypothetical protein FNF29_08268 [Cafeteria roenbergensis]|uniref:Copper transport protein n=1 Tax=Cafeteria roenbergensis TaxID=33653 RepID=A0A5A8C1V8_CAFRO|nr:hypothetical protein FNF29_08268 [Cafeteria roenbergensis]|eukprot:KAA0146080.1 hypothetical protein FNF29_08268 [Cafeteria roenbergensis]